MTTHAIRINEATLPLITVINGGVQPSTVAFGDYYLFDIDPREKDITSNHRIISSEEYRTTGARRASSFNVNHWNN